MGALGHSKEASDWAARAAAQATYFHNIFWDAGAGRYDNGAMITYVLPLALPGTVPEAKRELLVDALVARIHARNGTWSGGIINNRFLFDVLHKNGHADLALAMLKRRDYPSYGYVYFNELEPAKECMWELADAPFEGAGMNSRNHHMFSSVGHYLVTRVAGFSQNPMEHEFTAVVGSEPTSTATLRTAEGEAKFSWTRMAGSLAVEVVVPDGLQARLHVPVTDGTVHKDGLEEVKVEEVTRHRQKFNMVVLGKGEHRFMTPAT